MANEDQLQNAKSMIEEIVKFPLDKLVTNPLWGTFNFNDVERELDQIYKLAGHLIALPIELIPDNPMVEVVASLQEARNACERIREFRLENSNNTRDERNSLAQQARGAENRLLLATANWIPFLAYQNGDVQRNIDQLRNAVGSAEEELKNGREAIKKKTEEIDGVVAAARDASATAGVAHFTKDFSDEANELKKQAQDWLLRTGILATVTLVVAFGSAFIPLPENATGASVVHLMTSKVVVLVALLGATIWCGRIYKATMHQMVTNKHRANSLKTFQAFVKATADNTTRDAVLLEATRSIFGLAASGYLDAGEPAIDTGTKVMEIFKGRPTSSGG
jgi:hypothetical protein